jgi:hypothetical protein
MSGGVKRSLVGRPGVTGTGGGHGISNNTGYLRDNIQDDFLVEHDEDDESSLRQSAESGEVQGAFASNKRRL